MSLLNDALRAAEQRQRPSQRPVPYLGRRPGRPRRRVALLVLPLVLAAGAVVAIHLWRAPQPVAATGEVTLDVTGDDESPPSPPAEVPARISRGPQDALAPPPAPVLPPPGPAPKPVEVTAAPVPKAPLTPPPPAAAVSAPVAEPVVSAPEPRTSVASVEPSSPPPVVKQVPRTPEARDRATGQELERLVREGRLAEAERRLSDLLARQPAPVSRAVVARALLVDGQAGAALSWLPPAVTEADPELRLLRARALLARGDLDGAVALLSHRIPPVAGHIEYRVTLATLLQQAGDSEAAAGHWTALLMADDSRAAWWVGLALALEGQGKIASAIRAYGQAAALPGLSTALADFVRERLRQLQAG